MAAENRPITIAILAMGGEGGGVLADWLVSLAESAGYVSQLTSVPGVAQRTGATIYYIEIFKPATAIDPRQPVLAMMPAPGEVDIVIASELMEAGRAVQRELVSADRTTLIFSTHRVYSMTEKMAMGDGRVDSERLMQAASLSARRFVAADFAELARQAGTVISAPLFGALAGSGALPFERTAFEATISASGVGVKASLAAFATAFDRAVAARAAGAGAVGTAATGTAAAGTAAAGTTAARAAVPSPTSGQEPTRRLGPRLRGLAQRLVDEFPAPAHETLALGVVRLADYQDEAYAGLYLDRLKPLIQAPAADQHLLIEAARHLALWMSYEDTIRVADLKTRAARFGRITDEQRVADGQLLEVREFLHPRLEEVADTLPAGFARRLLASRGASAWLARRLSKGRIVATHTLRGFLLLYVIAGLRRWRRSTLRFVREDALIVEWLAAVQRLAGVDPALALELVRLQRLVKGYGDTHARGSRNYCRIFECLPGLQGRADAAPRLAQLAAAALADESGVSLDRMLATHAA